MRIVHLVHNYSPSEGGSQDLIRQLAEGMQRFEGDACVVMTSNSLFSPHDARYTRIEPAREVVGGVEVQRFDFFRPSAVIFRHVTRVFRVFGREVPPTLTFLRNGPWSLSWIRALVRERPDVIVMSSAQYVHIMYPMIARWISRARPPLVMFGSLHVDRGISSLVLAVIRRLDAYVANTTYERDTLIARGIDPAILHVQGPAIEIAPFEGVDAGRARAALGIGDEPVVAFVGRIAAWKGVDTLIRSMDAVWSHCPQARLLIAGGRTSFSPVIEQAIADLPDDRRSRVTLLLDFSSADKPDLFAASDVFVSASSDESFGIVFLEAWASGRAVIAGRIGAVETVITDGVDGLLVTCGDEADLASKIIFLLDHPEERARLAANGREKVARENALPVVVRRLKQMYRDLGARRDAVGR